MSTATAGGSATADDHERERSMPLAESLGAFRLLALSGILILTSTYVWKLHTVTQVVEGDASGLLLPVVALTLVAATAFARYIDGRTAAVIAAVLIVLGYGYYLLVVPRGFTLLIDRSHQIVADVTALLTGLKILRIARADVWALGFAPGPVFLSWYLAVRRRYMAGATVGGLALFLLVLTDSAGIGLTVAGMLGGIAAVGFGELDRRGGTLLQADVLFVLVALITLVVFSSLVVPGVSDPLRLNFGGAGTVEGTIVGSPGEMQITGAVNLSPTVRYTVKADEQRYWRTGVYDRFTGSGWTRTGQSERYREGLLDRPPGDRHRVVQTFTAESELKTMPAAAEPVEVIGGATKNTRVTGHDTLKPAAPFIRGDQYRVVSMSLNVTAEQLRDADGPYPEAIRKRYLQTPESLSSEFRELTAEIAADADTNYDVAVRFERYLEREKEYSLDIRKPTGNVANKFLLKMDAGYCTYFATTMAMMLRSEGIPARIATGYTSGQKVGEDKWVLRGLDSHVWVEAYFPEQGWVKFDPTPAGPRQEAERSRLRQARRNENSGRVDTDDSEQVPVTTTSSTPEFNTTINGTLGPDVTLPDRTGAPLTLPDDPADRGQPTGPDGGANGTANGSGDGATGGLPPLPSGKDAAIGGVLLLGGAAAVHRTGLPQKSYRAARIRWQGSRESPAADVERAHERMELLLAREHRERDPGETHRDYVRALGLADEEEREWVERVVEIHERARYGGDVDRETADEAIELVDRMVREYTPILGPIRRGRRRAD